MKKIILLVVILFFIPSIVKGATNLGCPLDTSNPAITHTIIPMHGVYQGKAQYNDPSEWPLMSFQLQWAPANSMMFDASKGLLNPKVGHAPHIEPCYPYNAEIRGPITLPFRLQVYHSDGQINGVFGPMVRNIVWDNNLHLPLSCDEMTVCIFTGRFTYDPSMSVSGGAPGIDSAIVNGWTNFTISASFKFATGDSIITAAFTPLFTRLSDTAPEVPIQNSMPKSATYATINAIHDAQGAWGYYQVVDLRGWLLPVVGPFNVLWQIPTLDGYGYGADPSLQIGTLEIRKDMDLHNGNIGTHLNSVSSLDPNEIGPGQHKIHMIWKVVTGPNGIPGVAAPNEEMVVMIVINVEVGDGTIPPPVDVCPNLDGVQTSIPPGMILSNGQCIFPTPIWNSGFVFWKTGTPMTFELCPANDPLDLACQVQ